MIAFLRGRLHDKRAGRVVLDVHGVGYEVHVPHSTFGRLAEPGEEAALFIHTHVREDAISLFGFATAFELEAFELLIGISGIGPRLALAVLSGLEPAELARAVQTGDTARLRAIPGVGRKTAERIGLELKDRLLVPEVQAVPVESGSADLKRDLLSALLNLGYHRSFAEKAVEAALRTDAEPSFEKTLREALRELAR
jgi:holliday junction DNA helicase RuvA